MTLPGAIQALLILMTSVSAFVMYFRRASKQGFVAIVAGSLLMLLGLFLIGVGWNAPPSLRDVLYFRPPDFYQGTIIFSLGVGIVIGNIAAWLVSCALRMLKKEI